MIFTGRNLLYRIIEYGLPNIPGSCWLCCSCLASLLFLLLSTPAQSRTLAGSYPSSANQIQKSFFLQQSDAGKIACKKNKLRLFSKSPSKKLKIYKWLNFSKSDSSHNQEALVPEFETDDEQSKAEYLFNTDIIGSSGSTKLLYIRQSGSLFPHVNSYLDTLKPPPKQVV